MREHEAVLWGRSTLEPELAALYPATAARVIFDVCQHCCLAQLPAPQKSPSPSPCNNSFDDERLSAAVLVASGAVLTYRNPFSGELPNNSTISISIGPSCGECESTDNGLLL